jgi:RNA polymerase sigma-70 factor (ECF subfamily)
MLRRGAVGLDELCRLSRAGDVDAFAELFEYCGRRARRLLHRELVPQEAQDAVQEVFARALAGLPGFRGGGPASVSTWLAAIAHNHIIDLARARELSAKHLDPGGLHVLERWEPEDERQARALADVESEAEFDRLVSWLPKSQQHVLALRYRLGLDDRRIAGLLGVSEPAVWMLAQRALRSLRQRHASEIRGAGARDRLAARRIWIPRLQARFSLPSRRLAWVPAA